MKMRRKVATGILFLLLCCQTLSTGPMVYADDISDAQTEKKRLEEREQETKEDLASLKEEKGDLLQGIEKLDKKMSEVSSKLEEINGNYQTVSAEYEQLKIELAQAEQTEQDQYETMKQRMKYMYENGTQGYWELIAQAGSIGDLFKRLEYVNKITSYDQTMLKNYQETKAQVEEKTIQTAEKQEQLSVLQQEAELEKENLTAVTKVKKQRLQEYNASIKEKSKEALAYQKKIQKKEEEIDQMLLEEAQKNQSEGIANGTLIPSTEGLIWPLPSAGRITSKFGRRSAPTAGASTYHKGIDIAISSGTDIYAAANGTVTTATYSSSAGNYVMIKHDNGLYTAYMHASRLYCKVGDQVSQGDKIAEVGSTGISTGAHLHFSVIVNGEYVNPEEYVKQP